MTKKPKLLWATTGASCNDCLFMGMEGGKPYCNLGFHVKLTKARAGYTNPVTYITCLKAVSLYSAQEIATAIQDQTLEKDYLKVCEARKLEPLPWARQEAIDYANKQETQRPLTANSKVRNNDRPVSKPAKPRKRRSHILAVEFAEHRERTLSKQREEVSWKDR